ncbi:MAG: NAD(P)/FAD-dependent oxidoreductase [Spongiibacteraceae bacterium]|jgi:NADH dehydrogenase|nr:NAD(P)/FAD-dependent oxidoreductase [Spongiibacteraceae bacterium]
MAPRIVVVGGGAGGLPLVTRLGKQLGKRGLAQITLIDANLIHVWKPRFHEVATGALDAELDAVDYRAHARENHYEFQLGSMSGLDRETREVILAPIVDKEGDQVLPERRIPYDYLVIAIGSGGNDFGTPGVRQHCLFLDSKQQADRFHRDFLNTCMTADFSGKPVSIAIVGAGATGVELAAEIHHAVDLLKLYGHHRLDRSKLQVHLIEAAPRILPPLSERVAKAAHEELTRLGVQIHVNTMVECATEKAFITKDGKEIPGDLLVWAAGVKAPPVLAELGLETSRGQLVVNDRLQTSDPSIFALGDCSACPDGNGKTVPPRAQSAQQMAKTMARNMARLVRGEPLEPFVYKDRGSLVSLSRFDSVGNLMGNLKSGNLFVEGWLARIMYVSLYRMHQASIYGWPRAIMLILGGRFSKMLRPRMKLH